MLRRAAAWILCVWCAGCNAIDSGKLTPIAGRSSDSGIQPDGGPDGDQPDGGPPPAQRDCNGVDLLDTCTRDNAVTACVDGTCLLVQCVESFVDCDGKTDNGCEATLGTTEHCGFCNAPCALAHAEARCNEGTCELEACKSDYDDCDENPSNGCETSLTTLQSCGACGAACDAVVNGAPACLEGGECGVGACLGVFGDCDEEPDNGCEEPLVGDNCGGCGVACELTNATGNCDSGACIVAACTDDYYDCNGLPGDGCEGTYDSILHCGTCGASCSLPHAEALACSTGGTPACAIDHGCAEGATACTDGARTNGCEEGYADCNSVASDGCEARLGTLVNCGGCGDRCVIPNAITACSNTGQCVRAGCEPGFGQCVAGGPCISLASDEDNCGGCGDECAAAQNCYGGVCSYGTCDATHADCDSTGTCETDLTSTNACGQCGLSCGSYAHATTVCRAGRCDIGACAAGFADCDGAIHNGCEVDTRTLDTCGSCTAACTIPGAVESCDSGTCTFEACEPDRANCNADLRDGCETNINLPGNCGACGHRCMDLPNVLSGGCADKRCQIICQPGFADCDQDPNNGCEAELDAPDVCGGCGIDCTDLPNVVSSSCGDSGCEDVVCELGFADCDGLTANGCESSTRTLTDCGGCNVPCALAHASASCSTGICTITTCSAGFDNCDERTANGCEASLGDPDTCGRCNKACEAGWACSSGNCKCTSSGQCGDDEECCNGECKNTHNVCSYWACPSEEDSRPTVNCDACNSDCRSVGAQWCCAL